MKKSILDKEAVEIFRKEKKLQPFKIKQINYEIFRNQKIDFDEISTISNSLKKELQEKFIINSLTTDRILEDDQTTKI
jgi:adenine C2-methylase RlmN of 23S rRNA A2503 and tRNA A37